MNYTKLCFGYVEQTFDSETGDCVEQRFIPDGRIERQDSNADPIADTDELERIEKECAPDMVQP